MSATVLKYSYKVILITGVFKGLGTLDAKALFEHAREAAREKTRTLNQLEVMQARKGYSSPSLNGLPGGSRADANGTGAIIEAINMEGILAERIRQADAEVAQVSALLYGANNDGQGGVAVLLSPAHADVLWWHYLADAKWDKVARECGVSRSRAHRMRLEAFDMIDSVGYMHTIQGRGIAED